MSDVVILTGAGFTKNFGGFLGEEMWAKIFNNPKLNQFNNLRLALRNTFLGGITNEGECFDYEFVYSTIIENKDGKYSKKEREVFQEVIEEAYKNLDIAISEWIGHCEQQEEDSDANIRKVMQWFHLLFEKSKPQRKLFFTLNQDLFIERVFSPKGGVINEKNFTSEKIGSKEVAFSDDALRHEQTLDLESFIDLPSNDSLIDRSLIDNREGVAYIKLHGSYGWKGRWAVGTNKKEIIEKEPLLKYYFSIFENVLKSGGKKVLIIGYGFGDKHINDILGKYSYDNSFYVVDTKTPKEFHRNLHNFSHDILSGTQATNIWQNIKGYFPYSLNEVFKHNGKKGSSLRDEITNALMGD